MKNIFIITILFVAFSVTNCNKEYNTNKPIDSTIHSTFKAAEPGLEVSLSFKAGHEKGQLCYYPFLGDVWHPPTSSFEHIPCFGKGEKCTWTITITFGAENDSIKHHTLYPVIATLHQGINYDTIHMPSKNFIMQDSTTAIETSINESEDGFFINMPNQAWLKIDSTHFLLPLGIEFDTIPF